MKSDQAPSNVVILSGVPVPLSKQVTPLSHPSWRTDIRFVDILTVLLQM